MQLHLHLCMQAVKQSILQPPKAPLSVEKQCMKQSSQRSLCSPSSFLLVKVVNLQFLLKELDLICENSLNVRMSLQNGIFSISHLHITWFKAHCKLSTSQISHLCDPIQFQPALIEHAGNVMVTKHVL